MRSALPLRPTGVLLQRSSATARQGPPRCAAARAMASTAATCTVSVEWLRNNLGGVKARTMHCSWLLPLLHPASSTRTPWRSYSSRSPSRPAWQRLPPPRPAGGAPPRCSSLTRAPRAALPLPAAAAGRVLVHARQRQGPSGGLPGQAHPRRRLLRRGAPPAAKATSRDPPGATCPPDRAAPPPQDGVKDVSSPLPHMMPAAAAFGAAMDALGVGNGDQVVVYDCSGLFSAARAWWMLRAFGHSRVAVLEGVNRPPAAPPSAAAWRCACPSVRLSVCPLMSARPGG